MVIGSGLTVSGNGRVGDPAQPTINHGRIIGGTDPFSSVLVTGSTITNHGTFQAGNGRYLGFGGTYTRAQPGNLVYTPGGTHGGFVIKGTLLNDGQVFPVNPSTGPWYLSGTIRGGTVETSGGVPIIVGYATTIGGPAPILDGAAVNGSIVIQGGTRLYVGGGGVLRGNLDVELLSPVLEGPPQLAPLSSSAGLTIEPGVTVHGGSPAVPGGEFGAVVGETSARTHNRGTIRPGTLGKIDLKGQPFVNGGTIDIGSDGVVTTNAQSRDGSSALVFEPGGQLSVEISGNLTGGQLIANGSLDLAAPNDRLDLALSPGLSPFTYYRIATATQGILGTFDLVTPGFDVRYTEMDILVAQIPEPATAAFVAAVTILLMRPRRRHSW